MTSGGYDGQIRRIRGQGSSGYAPATGVLTINIVDGKAVAGDMVEVWCDGTNWFAVGADVTIAAGASPQLSSANRVQIAWAQYAEALPKVGAS